ncbi:MAG: aminomethyltransferase family protein, partial [Thermoplasmata archaeon]
MTGPAAPPLRRSPLDGFHRAHGAHMVPFAGWEMPLYVSGILEEHRAVRGAVGLFDVSHMGILTVRGTRAADLLSRRTTADAHRIPPGQCRYAFWLDSDGHIFDDLLLSRLDDGLRGEPEFLVVPNAGRADRIEALLRMHRVGPTEVRRHNGQVAILAVQGPGSRELLTRRYGWPVGELKFYTARSYRRPGEPGAAGRLGVEFPDPSGTELLVSRTGYTGEAGYELFVPADRAREVAEELVAAGALPCGLGARDTLRLEKGYLLSGSEFHLDRTPLEA